MTLSQKTPMVYRLVLPLRYLILIIVSASAVAIIYGKSNYPPANPRQGRAFMDSTMLAINIIMAVVYSISIFSKRECNSFLRAIFAWIFLVSGYISSSTHLRYVNSNDGGCRNIAFAGPNLARCWINYSVAIAGFVWSGLILVEGVLTYKRDTDHRYQDEMSRQRAHRQQQSAVLYQPDLSLNENGESPISVPPAAVINSSGRPDGGEEPLPQYSYRTPTSDRMVIDMTNLPDQQRPTSDDESTMTGTTSGTSSGVTQPATPEPPSYSP
ncbi:hypothetical protein BG004_004411 [Podila humilis]|nr:hypothetical protein BG004_004411 [Podila humilis]